MQVSDALTYLRNLLSEPSSSQRWSDTLLTGYLDRAQKVIVRDIRFPESRFVLNSIAGVQEYQLSEVHRILRVYIQGQPIIRTTIPQLEGTQIEMYDQSGQGGGPTGEIIQGQPSIITVGPYTPQWTGQPALTYPVASNLGYPNPTTAPWFPGKRPEYYIRGGNIGFVPPPAGVYPIVVDCVRQPQTLTEDTDYFVLPDIAMDAICWLAATYAYFSDRGENTSGQVMQFAQTESTKAMGDLRTWKRKYSGEGPKGPKPLTQRSFFRKGNNRYFGRGW